MKHVLYSIIFILISIASMQQLSAAVKVVECEDEEGNRAFYKICPPNTKEVSEKNFSTGSSGKENSSATLNISATLYTVPDCDTCDEVREFLQNRKISITEKNVNDDLKIQNELTELTGALRVPSVTIGEKTITGYNRSELKKTLEAAGYVEEKEEDS